MNKLTILIFLLLTSCVKSEQIIDNIEYFQDKRTGVCFAWIYNDAKSFTSVPCDSVKQFLK